MLCERDGLVWFQALEAPPNGVERTAWLRLGPVRRDPAWIQVRGTEVGSWTQIHGPPDLASQADRGPRLLVLLHDALSSTAGTFGLLSHSRFGRDQLRLWDERRSRGGLMAVWRWWVRA
jgi:hypothetical protein